MKKRSFILITMFISMLFAKAIYAQGEVVAGFLTLHPGGKANAMGGANTALATDFWGTYYNPGGIGFIQSAAAGFYRAGNKYFNFGSLKYYYGGGAYRIPSIGVIGLSIAYWSPGEQEWRDENNNLLGVFHSYEMAPMLTFARQLSEHVSFGVNMKYIRIKPFGGPFIIGGQSSDGTGNSVAFDVGFLIKNILPQFTFTLNNVHQTKFSKFKPVRFSPGLSFGVTIRNMGSAISFFDGDQADPIPTEITLGLAYTALEYGDFLTIRSTFDLSKLLVKRTYNESTDSFQSETWVRAMVTSWKDDGFDEVMFGLEADFFHLGAFRMGKHIRNFLPRDWDDYTTFGLRIGPECLSLNIWTKRFDDIITRESRPAFDNIIYFSANLNLSDIKLK